jgi:hypothetical protein
MCWECDSHDIKYTFHGGEFCSWRCLTDWVSYREFMLEGAIKQHEEEAEIARESLKDFRATFSSIVK